MIRVIDNVVLFVIAINLPFLLHTVSLHALSCTCPFTQYFTLRSHYTPFTVLLLLHAVSFTCAFSSISITRLRLITTRPFLYSCFKRSLGNNSAKSEPIWVRSGIV